MNSVAPSMGFSIGELSRRSGVNIETIRYYERVRILPTPHRTASGRRVYSPTEGHTLTFIRRARELGFALDEIRALLALAGGDGSGTCAEVREIAARHLAEIGWKITDLRAMEQFLAETVALRDTGKLSRCPVIETLSAG